MKRLSGAYKSIRRSTIRTLIAAVLSASLLLFIHTPAPQINISTRTTKVVAVQAQTPRKASTAPSQTLTEQQAVSKPETVIVSNEKPIDNSIVKQSPVSQGCDAYRNIISQYSWNVTTAVAICKAESGGDTNALSKTCDRGLFQINCIHADMVNGNLSNLYNPTTNISVAWKIYSANGWSAWSTFKDKAYLRYE